MKRKSLSGKLDLTPQEMIQTLKDPHLICPVRPSTWALVRTSLAATPYVQFRLHSFRLAGGGRKWVAAIVNEWKNKVLVKGGGDSPEEAVMEMTLTFGKMARKLKKTPIP